MQPYRGSLMTIKLPGYEVDKDARTIADLVKDGEDQAASKLYNELVNDLALWEGLVLQDRINTILNKEYPTWRTDRGIKVKL